MLRAASEFPGRLTQRDGHAGLRLEFLEKRLATLVGIGLGEGELRVHVEQRRGRGFLGDELVEEAGDSAGLEVQLGVDPADQVGRCLEAERGPGEGALLLLVHADQIDGPAIAERVPRREPEDVGRCHGEEAVLLEPRGHLRRALTEQGVGIEEGDLAEVVGDRVVEAADQLSPADEQLLAPVAKLEGVEVERRAVAAAGGVVVKTRANLAGGPSLSRRK